MEIKEENGQRIFSTGATKNISKGKGRYDLIPTEALMALAKRFEYGVLNGHEENGYRKGIPDEVLYDSALRHIIQAEAGYVDEDHLGAAMWNIAVLIFNRENRPQTSIDFKFGNNGLNIYEEKQYENTNS